MEVQSETSPSGYSFGEFRLDPANRRLLQNGAPLDLNARYLDALALLIRSHGQLVTKERFLAEVWRGVPVTDEALTQCIRTLRRLLGDSASNPTLIETVPKHGYRFIGLVELAGESPSSPMPPSAGRWRQPLRLGLAGTLGGALAGLIGGLIYGLIVAAHPLAPQAGALSLLLVVLTLTGALAMVGAAGIAFGLAVATALAPGRSGWLTAGAGVGGLLIGAIVNRLAADAFHLLIGTAPRQFTGALEGLALGLSVGASVWLARRWTGSVRRAVATGAVSGTLAGLAVALAGGVLMAGSLDQLSRQFPGGQLRIDRLGLMFGEEGFGFAARIGTAMLEGLLFAACVTGAIILAQSDERSRQRS